MATFKGSLIPSFAIRIWFHADSCSVRDNFFSAGCFTLSYAIVTTTTTTKTTTIIINWNYGTQIVNNICHVSKILMLVSAIRKYNKLKSRNW